MDEGIEARRRAGVERVYATERIEVTWDPSRCTHVGRCFHTLPDVFDPRARPWVRPEAADPDTLAEVVMSCPTGALGFRRLDGGPQEEELVGDGMRVRARPDGPLEIRGRTRLVDAHRHETQETRAWLCRCGASEHKPFCDNSHLRADFRDPQD
jgi:uncharacterized Fe-S cluster protein YjdI